MNKIMKSAFLAIITAFLLVGCGPSAKDLFTQNIQLSKDKDTAVRNAQTAGLAEKVAQAKLATALDHNKVLGERVSEKDQIIGHLKSDLAHARSGRYAARQEVKGAQKVAATAVNAAAALEAKAKQAATTKYGKKS